MAQYNEYDSFDYLKAADLTKAHDESINPNAWADTITQVNANNKIRAANANQGIKNQTQALKLSTTLAKSWKDHTLKRDQRLMNEAYQIHLEAGITQQKLVNYNKRNQDKDDFQRDVGLYNELAAKARAEGNYKLADRLEDMTGHKLKMAKQSLLKNAAINWRSGWEREKENYSIDREDGSVLTFGNIRDEGEYNLLVREHNLAMGFTDVSWASPEFIDEHFRKTMEREQANGLYEWRSNRNKVREAERVENWERALIEGAQTGTLAETVHELMETQFAFSSKGTQRSMREDLAGILAKLVDQNKVNKDRGIPVSSLAGFNNWTFYHRGTKSEKPLSFFAEFDDARGGILQQKILEVQSARLNSLEVGKVNRQREFMNNIDAQVLEHGLPTEAELKQLITVWNSDPLNAGVPLPEGLKNYLTVEDREDNEIVAAFDAKVAAGMKILPKDWIGIHDPDLRKEYQQKASGPLGTGISQYFVNKRTAEVPSIVAEQVKMLGIQGTKSDEYNVMLANAEAEYNSIILRYAGKEKFETEAELHDYAIQQVKSRVENGQISGVRESPTDPRKFTRELTEGRKFLLEGHKQKGDTIELLKSQLIPGSATQYKRVEAFAANPNRQSIPLYYQKLADSINGVTAWEIMNYQYMSQNGGKELPKLEKQDALEKESPFVQGVIRSTSASYKSINRSQKIANNYDFNSKESLIQGVTA